MKRGDSPYSAALGGGGFLFEETDALLPLLLSDDSAALLKDEIVHNRLLGINAERTRSKAVLEIRRRYQAMSPEFWVAYQALGETDRRGALLHGKAGMWDKDGNLRTLRMDDSCFHLKGPGEAWMLEAALMAPYEIGNLKRETS